MRRTVIALGWLLCPAPLLAAPAPAGQSPAAAPATQAQLQAAAHDYAQNLFQVVATIQAHYVRPVDRTDLVVAALTGLYEAAQVPVPAGLKEAVKKANKDTTDQEKGKVTVDRGVMQFIDGKSVRDLIEKTRADLGNPEALQGHKALLVSCRAMMRSLDPFCAVVTGEEATAVTGFDQNYGLGIDLVERTGTGPLVVKAVVPGGPAQRAGLQAGDRIMRVDGKDAQTLSTERALRLLNGGHAAPDDGPPPPPGLDGDAPVTPPASVTLTVRSAGDKEERKVSVRRESFRPETVQGVARSEDNSWDFWVDRKKRIAHVRVVTLAQHTPFELEQVLDRLDRDGLRGLILDLRWCPGGYLTAATGVASLFIEDGVIAKTDIRAEGQRVYRAEGGSGQKFLKVPMLVLVNGETTGGGELIAAALQDHHRAAVAGQRTRGKGSIQTPAPVYLADVASRLDGERLQLKLTNGTFLRPSGKNLGRFADSKPSDDWGVRPDVGLEFRTSADLGRRLKEWWQQQALRPGASNKALPLDDPDQDPQRQAALKALRGLMAPKK
jgi:carboxyl-terminal processing protease